MFCLSSAMPPNLSDETKRLISSVDEPPHSMSVSSDCESRRTTRNGDGGGAPRICLREFTAELVASDKSLRVTEGEHSFVVPSPRFRSSARFELRGLTPHSHMTVGYIQVVTSRHFRLVYTHGEAEWQFDGIPKDGAISDSDGRMLPFFGIDGEVVSFRRGVAEQEETRASDGSYYVEMKDEPRAKLCWRMPSAVWRNVKGGPAPGCVASAPTVELRSIERRQKFCTWLAVHDHVRQTLTPVTAVEWEIDLSLDIDPSQPVGRRTTWQPVAVRQPTVLASPPAIPLTALHNTRTANNQDRLTWRPSVQQEPLVVVPSAECRLRIHRSPPPLLGRSDPSASGARDNPLCVSENKSSPETQDSNFDFLGLHRLAKKVSGCARKIFDQMIGRTENCQLIQVGAPGANHDFQ